MIPTPEMKKLRAFHSDPEIKKKYLDRVLAHQKADEIQKGFYWEGGKGCAVGCTIEGNQHNQYEKELGIPEALARLEDYLFEWMPNDKAKEFPVEFLEAISVGADLSLVPAKFIHAILTDLLEIKEVKEDEAVAKSIVTVANLWQGVINGEVEPKSAAWSAARSAARSAAWSAARSAARSAAESAAESAAWSAAWSAAESAARSAAWSAAESAAWSAATFKMSRTLLEILRQEK